MLGRNLASRETPTTLPIKVMMRFHIGTSRLSKEKFSGWAGYKSAMEKKTAASTMSAPPSAKKKTPGKKMTSIKMQATPMAKSATISNPVRPAM